MKLRPLQVRFIDDLRESFRSHRRVLGVAATGFGKTVCFAYMAHASSALGKRVLILTHRTELVDQIEGALREFGGGATVASIQTVARRPEWPTPDFVVVDECHHAAASSWSGVLARWPRAHILGVTATPARLDGRGLGDLFDAMVMGPDAGTLIEQGLLCRPVYYAPSAPDVSEVSVTAGDFDRGELFTAMDQPSITGSAVAEYQKRASGEQSLVFCVNRLHAQNVAQQFQDCGIDARVFHGGLSDGDRTSTMAKFREGSIKMLVTVDLVGEGLDVCAVGAVILLRPTASLCLHLQQIGRGLRTAPGKERVVILDHAANLSRHGLAEWTREWSLQGRPKRTRKGDVAPVAVLRCPTCYACWPPGVSSCSDCGHEFTARERKMTEKAGELVEVRAKQCPRCGGPTVGTKRCGGCARNDTFEEHSCRTLSDWKTIAKRRGYSAGWAWKRFNIRKQRQRSLV